MKTRTANMVLSFLGFILLMGIFLLHIATSTDIIAILGAVSYLVAIFYNMRKYAQEKSEKEHHDTV